MMETKLNGRGEIASVQRYARIWVQAQERLQKEVLVTIDEALAEYGPLINCAMLHRYLRRRFPFAVCWGSVDHVLTEIGGCLYDKTGLVAERVPPDGPVPGWFDKSFRWPKTNDFLETHPETAGRVCETGRQPQEKDHEYTTG